LCSYINVSYFETFEIPNVTCTFNSVMRIGFWRIESVKSLMVLSASARSSENARKMKK
ncbi:2766_t:CDS:2, partial [Funneliformis geosporum]